MQSIKLVTTGTRGVGKTCMLFSYTCNAFSDSNPTLMFDNTSLNVQHNKKFYNLGLFDTAGGEDYNRLRPLSYPQTDVFILCFSLIDKSSYDEIWDGWYEEICTHCPKTPIVLVGTKLDLRHKTPTEQCLSTCDGVNMAKKIGAVAYIECSSLLQTNLKYVFNTCIDVAMSQLPKPPKDKESKGKKGVFSQVKSIFKPQKSPEPVHKSLQDAINSFPEMKLFKLPVHVIKNIFTAYLTPGDTVKLCRVSKAMNLVANNDEIWTIYCQLIDPTFFVGKGSPAKSHYKFMVPVWINDFTVPPLPPPPFTHRPLSF